MKVTKRKSKKKKLKKRTKRRKMVNVGSWKEDTAVKVLMNVSIFTQSVKLTRKGIADLGRSAFMYTHQRAEKLTPGALFPANLKGMGGALKEIDVNIDMNKERVGDKKLLPTPT